MRCCGVVGGEIKTGGATKTKDWLEGRLRLRRWRVFARELRWRGLGGRGGVVGAVRIRLGGQKNETKTGQMIGGRKLENVNDCESRWHERLITKI